MWLAKGAAAFCYIHQTSCHKDPCRCPCTADRFHSYIQPPPPQITTQGQLSSRSATHSHVGANVHSGGRARTWKQAHTAAPSPYGWLWRVRRNTLGCRRVLMYEMALKCHGRREGGSDNGGRKTLATFAELIEWLPLTALWQLLIATPPFDCNNN